MVDLNPLHYINKFNHMFGDTVADGLEFLGITDPAVDPDGIRELAKKWRALAKGLDDAAEAARKSLADVEWEGKAAKALHKRATSARKQATEMADSLREGAKALDDFADKAHELLSEIGVILAEIAELELAGLALSVLTGGTSAVVSTLMAGSRAAKVVALVARIEQEGTVLASAIRGVMEVIRAVERALKTLKEIRGVAAAGKMAKEGMKFSAFDTLLRDPEAFKDPEKLAGILTEGALLGVGFGALGKALGKGLKALKPADLAKLSKGLKLNCATFERLSLNPGFNRLPASIRNTIKTFVRDPIDVATGEMVLPLVDVSLPGVLPLILERTHLSSYRWGGWFGPSWASTIDQRVQVHDDGFVYAAPDGARICFPVLDRAADASVSPHGPGSRLTLSWDQETDGGVCVTDLDSGLVHVFHSPVTAADGEAVDLPLQHIQDRNGNRITVVYAQGDVPRSIVHSAGHHIALDLDPAQSRITGLRLLDPAVPGDRGTTILTFGYDADGLLITETNSSGLPLRYTYDADGRLTSWVDRNDIAYGYAYDERGRVVSTGGTGNALSSRLTYDDATRTTRVTDSLGHVRIYEHSEMLRLIRETDPLGNVTKQEWDADLQLIATTDPLGRTTRYGYDEQGRVVSVTRPDGREICATYNELGLPAAVVGTDGTRWLHEYDDHGNPTSVTDPAGGVIRNRYNSVGHLTETIDVFGHVTRYHCDPAGLPQSIMDPLGASTRYERDAFGRPVAMTDQLGNTTRLEWSVEGQLVRSTAPDGSAESWCYDGEGNCISHTDAVGAVSRFEYTFFDLPSTRTEPNGSRYAFTYDTELRISRVTNPQGLEWTYSYDAAGNPTSETDFGGRTFTYTHDAVGQLIGRTDALGQTISFQRNAMGLVSSKNAAGRVTSYEYDSADRLVRAAGPDTSVSMVRDVLGRVHAETVDGRTVTHAYDEAGRRTTRVTPTGVRSVWTYDSAGNAVRMEAAGRSVDFTYDPTGRESNRRFGTALEMAYAYDPLGRLRKQLARTSEGTVVQQRDYAYRADGYLTKIEDGIEGSRRYDLDAAGRVTGVHADGWTESYVYDAAGNQTAASWPSTRAGHEAATGERVYDGVRVTRAGNVRYEHDALGRIVLRQKVRLSRGPDTWRYEWDAEDHLTAVVTPDGTRWQYSYDPLGRRTVKSRLSEDGKSVVERVDFAWDGVTLCEQTTTSEQAPNPVTLTWMHQGLHPVAQAERITTANVPQEEIDARFYAVITDLVGTPAELVDEYGVVAWHAHRTLWGTTAWSAASTAYTPLRFPGQYHDFETGLHYNYFRYYDPETARYITFDPLGLEPAPNPATYVHNPHTWVDPLGLAPAYEAGKRLPEINVGKDQHGKIPFDSYEQARNKALEIVGRIDPHTRVPYVSRLGNSAAHGRVVGFETRVEGEWKQFRLDYDPAKGPHINVAVGRGGQRYAVRWNGTEADMLRILKGNS
ncbi:DUF6531 domain-containing protein [Streptomyces sp. NPDC021139]|uniref:DUF6531 domain-containing protein n=1 Tax=unclassified Streptomyces TaxID=2593676 RepID=UPI0034062C9A